MLLQWYTLDSMFDPDLTATSASPAAVTLWARRISTVGGSLRDVQLLAGHSALGATQRYIECSDEAKRRVVQVV